MDKILYVVFLALKDYNTTASFLTVVLLCVLSVIYIYSYIYVYCWLLTVGYAIGWIYVLPWCLSLQILYIVSLHPPCYKNADHISFLVLSSYTMSFTSISFLLYWSFYGAAWNDIKSSFGLSAASVWSALSYKSRYNFLQIHWWVLYVSLFLWLYSLFDHPVSETSAIWVFCSMSYCSPMCPCSTIFSLHSSVNPLGRNRIFL